MRTRRPELLVILALLAVCAGCGGGDGADTEAGSDTRTSTTATQDNGVTTTGATTTEPPTTDTEPDGPGCCIGAVFLQVPDQDDPTFTIQVTNSGASEVTDVTLTNTLSNDAADADASEGTCELSGNSVSCAIGTLQPGESVTVTVRLASQTEGDVTSDVQVAGESPTGGTLRKSLRRRVELPSLAPPTATS